MPLSHDLSFSAEEAKKLFPRIWAATIPVPGSGTILVRAFLKENAWSSMRKVYPEIVPADLYGWDGVAGGGDCCDQLVPADDLIPTEGMRYVIVMKKNQL